MDNNEQDLPSDGESMAVDGLLREMARAGRGADERFVRGVMNAVRGAESSRRVPVIRVIFRRVALPLAAAAAAMVCVYGGVSYQAKVAEKEVVGRVVEVRGNIEHRSESRHLITDNKEPITLRLADSVATGPDGYVKYAYRDGSVVELEKDTRMALDARRVERLFGLVHEPRNKMVKLDAGNLDAKVTKQKPGCEMVLVTPHAEMTVVGTQFKLKVLPEKTRLDVAEGVVRMKSLTESNTVDVSAGFFAEAGPGIKTVAIASVAARPDLAASTTKDVLPSQGLLPRKWDFNAPARTGDLRILTGSWHFVSEPGKAGEGHMLTDSNYFCTVISLPVQRLPVCVSFRCAIHQPLPRQGFVCRVLWEHAAMMADMQYCLGTIDIQYDAFCATRFYVTDRFIAGYSGDKQMSLAVTEREKDSRLALFLIGKYSVDDLYVEEVTPAQVPDNGRLMGVYDSIVPEDRNGVLALTGIPAHPAYGPGKKTLLVFHPPGPVLDYIFWEPTTHSREPRYRKEK